MRLLVDRYLRELPVVVPTVRSRLKSPRDPVKCVYIVGDSLRRSKKQNPVHVGMADVIIAAPVSLFGPLRGDPRRYSGPFNTPRLGSAASVMGL